MALIGTFTFEEGTDGAAANSATGIAAAAGSPIYSASAAAHGSLGILLESDAAALVAINSSGQESVYVTINSVGVYAFSTLWDAKYGGTFHYRLNADVPSGKFVIQDGARSTTYATSAMDFPVGVPLRFDIRREYAAPNLTLTVRIFAGANVEGTVPDEVLTTAPFAVSQASTRAGAQANGDWSQSFDTVRVYDDVSTWPEPFAPSNPDPPPDPVADTAPDVYADFNDGTIPSWFNPKSLAAVGGSYAHEGAYGVRLSPDGTLTVAGAAFPANERYAAAAMWFRLVTDPDPANVYDPLFEIGNNLTTSPKGQMTVYFNAGDLVVDFEVSDAVVIAPAPTDGLWHKVEAYLDFGVASFTGAVRYDSGTPVPITAAGTKDPTTARVLWIGYPSGSNNADYTRDVDQIALATSSTPINWLTEPAAAPTVTAAITATVDLSATALPVGSAAAAITASVDLSATVVPVAVVAADLAATAGLEATAAVPVEGATITAALTATATLEATAIPVVPTTTEPDMSPPPTPAVPITALTARVLDGLGPAFVDRAGPQLGRLVNALTGPLAETDDLLTPTARGWIKAFDLDTSPDPRWIGAATGTTVPEGLALAEQRDYIRARPNWRRGTPGAILAAAAGVLLGGRRVQLIERDGSPWRLTVQIFAAELPSGDVSAAAAAIASQKPVGIVVDVEALTGTTYAHMAALHGDTYAAWAAEFPTYAAAANHLPEA